MASEREEGTRPAVAAGPARPDGYDTSLLDSTPNAWWYLSAAWAGY